MIYWKQRTLLSGSEFSADFCSQFSLDPFDRILWTVGINEFQWHTQEFCSGREGVQQIQLRTEDRENGDLGAVAP